ncbi:MAG: hypothetical protein Kow0031_08120 [Anaerolineae bacterium]
MSAELSHQPLTAAQVLEEIRHELATPPQDNDEYIVQRIAEIRAAQKQLRATPVIGKFAGIKRFFFAMTNSTFSRQFNLNEQLLELVEELYHELHQQRQAQLQFQMKVTPQADLPSPDPTRE